MFKLLRVIFWLAVAGALVVVIDQALLRAPLETPGLVQVQRFYVDFRGRLFSLVGIEKAQDSIGRMIETAPPLSPQTGGKGRRYLYVDENGALQVADSYEQVPRRYRKDAQPLAE